MKIYIDFDDVICETAVFFSGVVKELFHKEVPYREMQFFNLEKSFDLSEEEYEELMRVGHLPEKLLAYEETPGASAVINSWLDQGHEVSIITGRPFLSYQPSRQWLDEHGLDRVPLFCVDKYGREGNSQGYTFSMTLEELYGMQFDFAIEDSPASFEHVMNLKDCRILVFDRPWNQKTDFPDERFVRCRNWQEIQNRVK